MTRFIAKKDGYLSDVCMHIREGQVVDFPEGREPKIDLNDPYNWLVPEEKFKPEPVLPQVGAVPVVSEQKPKAHEIATVHPDYDQHMALIQTSEGVQDGTVNPMAARKEVLGIVPQVVTPEVQASVADVVSVPQIDAPASDVTVTDSPIEPVAQEGTENQSSGDQEVI